MVVGSNPAGGAADQEGRARLPVYSGKWQATRAAVKRVELRDHGAAFVLRLPATWMKGASGRDVRRAGHFAGKLYGDVGPPLGAGNSREQRDRVRVARMLENLADRARFNDSAQVHDGDSIAQVPHDRQVVRNEQHRQMPALADALQQPQDLRLH